MNGKPELYLNGIELPVPVKGGLQITRNRIWSSNAGRNSATGEFKGDLIAMKYSVILTYENLKESEMKIFWDIAESFTPFHILEFYHSLYDERKRIRCYVPEPTLQILRWNYRPPYQTAYERFTIEFIEK